MSTMTIRKAAKEDLLMLKSFDFTWEAVGRFDVVVDGDAIRLTQTAYDSPIILGNNEDYHTEIERYASICDQPDALILVACVDNKPVGYLSAFIEEWKNGLVINADGVLVARDYRNQGVAKMLLGDLIQRGKELGCRGIMIEMDTEKYEANKLLLSVGFVFAGTRFYIRSNDDPKLGSKEAVYFYYKL